MPSQAENNRVDILKLQEKQETMEKEATKEKVKNAEYREKVDTTTRDITSIKRGINFLILSVCVALITAVAKGAGVF